MNCNPPATYAGAGESSVKRIDVVIGQKTLIAEGSGLLLIQQPYKNMYISLLLICKGLITVISDRIKISEVLNIEDEKVFITETMVGANTVLYQSFLTKGKF